MTMSENKELALKTAIRVLGPKEGPKKAREAEALNVTSSSKDWGQAFSPMLLGPVSLPSGDAARRVENAWQFSKVWPEALDNGRPTEEWWKWAREGWTKNRGERYPRGKGAATTGSWWNGRVIGNLDARRLIYAPLYAQAARSAKEWPRLREWPQASRKKESFPLSGTSTDASVEPSHSLML